MLRKKLSEWQRDLNAPQKTYVTLVDVVSPTAPEVDAGRPIRLGAVAFILGILLGLGIAYFRHVTRARRRARAAAAPAGPRPTIPPPARPRTRTAVRASASRWWPRGSSSDDRRDPAPAQPGTGRRQGDGPEGSGLPGRRPAQGRAGAAPRPAEGERQVQAPVTMSTRPPSRDTGE